MAKARKPSGTDAVNEYMSKLDHPLKGEIEAVRSIIMNANGKVAERVKWNAPSFYYKDDIAAFHPRATEYVHLVFIFHRGKMIEDGLGVLEGEYKDRRMAKFHGMQDIEARKEALITIINQWVEMTDEEMGG